MLWQKNIITYFLKAKKTTNESAADFEMFRVNYRQTEVIKAPQKSQQQIFQQK
jgi:hypothetical protein